MSAWTTRFTSRASGSSRATAVVACAAVMLLSGCGGSGESAVDSRAPVIRGTVLGSGTESGVVARVDQDRGADVNVFWDNADINLTQELIGYRVQVASGISGPWADAGSGCSFGTTGSSLSARCLMNNQASGTYSFRVAAITKTIGLSAIESEGPWSAGSPAVTVLDYPSNPIITMVAAGNAQVSVTVQAGTSGGAPTSITVHGYEGTANSGQTCTVTGTSGTCTVSGLTNGTVHTFLAVARNSIGTSPTWTKSEPMTPNVP